MELKDVEIKVENPNQEYWIGVSCNAGGNGWDNFYTDGTVEIIGDEDVYASQSNLVKVENATYVAIESLSDAKETDRRKMKDRTFKIIGSDPAETIKQVGLENIFNPAGSQSEDLTTSCVYSKQGKPKARDLDMLPRTWK